VVEKAAVVVKAVILIGRAEPVTRLAGIEETIHQERSKKPQ